MRISVITPVYNGEKYIEETITSVLKASENHEVEYLVIDDGSTDQTPRIVAKFGDKIRVISQANAGESAAVNTGFNAAVGDFVLVVSADDPLFTSSIFDGVIEFFDNNPHVVVWYPNWNIIDLNGNIIRTVYVSEYSDEKLIGRFICLPGPGTFIRRTVALKIGGRRIRWKFVGDYDFWLRISRVGTLMKRNAVLAQWRFHDESTSIAQRGERMYEERIRVIDEFLSEFSIPEPLSRVARAHSLYSAAQLSLFSKGINGRSTLLQAFRVRKSWIENSKLSTVAFLLFCPAALLHSPKLRGILKLWRKLII